MTIKITWADGTSTTYTECSGYAISNGVLTFRGKKQNESEFATYDYPWDAKLIKEVRRS